MKKLLLCAAIACLFSAAPARADSLSYDIGAGFYFSRGTTVNFLRYRHETDPIFGLGSYYEAAYATWNGRNNAEALSFARGVRWETAAKQSLNFAFGLSRISRTTRNLGQPFEFSSRLTYEISAGKALFSIGWVHYSDAKFLFRWSGPNRSENFAVLSAGLLF